MKLIIVLIACSSYLLGKSQNLSAETLLQKAINYHDPNENWGNFEGEFSIEMSNSKGEKRKSNIQINLPKEHFSIKTLRDSISKTYTMTQNNCYMLRNNQKLDSLTAKSYNMSCNRAKLLKNYYTYLYGLPMKLKDPGTQLHNIVEKRYFKGKEYWVLKVTYNAEVGKDIWYFYFNTDNYAMAIYQFYKTDKQGNKKPNSGEYIVLTDTQEINGIKLPKVRAWYTNKDNMYLGTDRLYSTQK